MVRLINTFASIIVIFAYAGCFDGFGSDPVPPPDSDIDLDVDQDIEHPEIDPDQLGDAFCGNGIVEVGEVCDDGNRIDGDGCDNDCIYSCRDDGDCGGGDFCSGGQTCNTDTHACEAVAPQEDGTVCMEDPRSICIDGICSPSTCGDGFVDTGGDEECEAGEEAECMTLCGTSGVGVCLDDCMSPTGWDCADGSLEMCNAVDDNCNGLLDDAFACVHQSLSSCVTACGSNGEGLCAWDCSHHLACISREICGNGTDDDCDDVTDEDSCVNSDEWTCYNLTFDDLGLTCDLTEMACIQYDSGMYCNTAFVDPDHDCDGRCINLETGSNGYCGLLWASRTFQVPEGMPVLRFSYKALSDVWGSTRGAAWEVEGRPETLSIIVECDTSDSVVACIGTDPGGDNTTWTEHFAVLTGLEGETIRVKLYIRDTGETYCNAVNHDVELFAKDFRFTEP